MRILFCAGGTGGHIFPIIAIKRKIEKEIKHSRGLEKEKPEFLFIGCQILREKELKEEGIPIQKITGGKWRRYFSFKNFIDLLKFPFSFFQALYKVWAFMPDVVFSKGGQGTFPIVLAAWLYQIPVVLHESDSIPGFNNKLSAKFSKKIFLSFEEAKKYFNPKKTEVSGHPIREKLLQGSKKTAKKIFNLSGERKIILALGGTQGAVKINELIVHVLTRYVSLYEIIHVCGERNFKELDLMTRGILKEEQRKYYHLYPFLDEEKLSHALAAADLVITRGGSSTIFEIAALEKPQIIIPLQGSAQNHQVQNARIFREKDLAIVIEEPNATPHFVFGRVCHLLQDEETLKKIKKSCQKFIKKNASQKIARYLLKVL